MTIEALSILIYALLLFAVVATQATYAGITAGNDFGFSDRENPQPGLERFGRRVDKTLANLKEGSIIYLPLALMAAALEVSNTWTVVAAIATIISRTLYVPIFFAGIPVLRTLIWAPSFVAMPLMAWGIVAGWTVKSS